MFRSSTTACYLVPLGIVLTHPITIVGGTFYDTTDTRTAGTLYNSLIPYYTQVKGIKTVLISMTSGDFIWSPMVREQQLRSAVWTYGLRCQPLFPRFRDLPLSLQDTWDSWADGILNNNDGAAGRLKASLYVAQMIRRYRPEVIATHGLNGEYGHGNHMATSQAVVDAWALASNTALEIDGLPAWQPKKLYLHEWGTNPLFHDNWETPYAALNGKTPRQVTLAGLQFHYDQSNVSTVYETGEVRPEWDAHPSEWWGLYATTVGTDTVAADFTVAGTTYSGWAKEDFLEHVTFPANPPPLIVCPSSFDVPYPWSGTLKSTVIDDSPPAALTVVWSLVNGPGDVTFSPSANVRKPLVSFSASGQYTLRIAATDGNASATRDVTVNVLPNPSSIAMSAINCGGPTFQGADGIVWKADTCFNGGATMTTPVRTHIAGTPDDALFQSQRVGNCTYAIPVPNGSYLVTLRFAETLKTQACLRRFHINLQNVRVTSSLDPFVEAGFNHALDRNYAVTVTGGAINLQLTGEVDQPAIAGILVRAALSDTPPPPIITPPPITPPLLAPVTDTDGDGISDVDEFTCGTSATTPDPPQLTLNSATRTLSFLTRVAEGAAYAGRSRHYRVETSTDLTAGSWTTLWEGAADGTVKQVPLPARMSCGFFRLVTILE